MVIIRLTSSVIKMRKERTNADLQEAEVLQSQEADDDEEEHLDDQALHAHDAGRDAFPCIARSLTE